MVVLLVAGMSLCFLPAAKAYGYTYGEKTNTVDMYVGYFGGPYAYIQTVTEDEMQNNCVCGEWTYSSIDNGLYTRYNLAYGVTMESLLSYCHITTSDISEIYFLGTDNNYYAGFHDLFGVPHYYFPYLAENYNQRYPDESNTGLINSSRIEVPAILAFEQSLYRDSGAFDYEKYQSMMDNDECLRIVFGQTVWNEVSTSDSVKWVYEIAVMLKGNPITVDNLETEYGSEMKIYVNSGFEELDDAIRSGLNITAAGGNDRVEVIENEDGTITVRALDSGNINVMVTYGEGGSDWDASSTVNAEGNNPDDNPNSGETGGDDPQSPDDPGNTGGSELTPDDDDDSKNDDSKNEENKNEENKNDENKNDDKNKKDDTTNEGLTTNPGSGGGAGSGGSGTGSGGTANGGNGSGSGSATQGNGAGGMLSSEAGGTTGTDNGSGDPTSDASGDASLNSSGVNVDAELVPMSAEGEAIYEQVKGYMMEQLDDLEDTPSAAQTALITEEVQQYIEDLIKQFEDADESLDMETILEMVRDYIDSLVAQLGTEEVSEDNAAESSEAAQSVYLSLGNVAGGDATGGSVSGSGTTGGSGGKMLEIEDWPTSYTVILIVVLAALFVAGGTYRSLRFRRETAR